jgi:hypothetical protein
MSTTTGHATTSATISTSTALKTGLGAGVVAAVLNVIVSVIARGPFGASNDFVPLTPGPIVFWTIVGAVIGAIGWRLIVNKKTDSRGLLNKLVPTVLVLSLIPDLALLGANSMPGHSTTAVIALMVMHVLTAAVVVTAYRKAMPPR